MSTSPQPEGLPHPQPGPAPAGTPPAPPPGAVYYYSPPTPPRRGFWGRLFLRLLIVLIGCSFLLNLILLVTTANLVGDGTPRVQEKFVSHDKSAEDKVAIIPIEGVILEAEDGFVSRSIDTAMKDEHVKAVVLRVDSPGGSVSGSDYIYQHLHHLVETKKIPLVVSMGSIAASGGYYVSMAVGHEDNAIFAEPTTLTGSIGVIFPHYNIAGFMKDHGLVNDSVASNPLKEMGSLTKVMTPEERKIFQALVNDNLAQFKKVVRSGRSNFDKKDDTRLDELATGRVYTANEAVKPENRLVDSIGYLEDAVNRAIELANLNKDKVKVVRYKPEAGLSSILLGGESSKSQVTELKALLEMTTPRAYYLASWLPGLAGAAN